MDSAAQCMSPAVLSDLYVSNLLVSRGWCTVEKQPLCRGSIAGSFSQVRKVLRYIDDVAIESKILNESVQRFTVCLQYAL